MSEGYVSERSYVVPLRDSKKASRNRRAAKAIRILKQFATRHMKAKEVKISNAVNEVIWARGGRKPPKKIEVVMRKDNQDTVSILLKEEAEKEEEAEEGEE